MSNNLGIDYRADALKLINNVVDNKNLLKTKKLCILQAKFEELGKLCTDRTVYKLDFAPTGKKAIKTLKSFLPY